MNYKNIYIVGVLMLLVGFTAGVYSAPWLVTKYFLKESPAQQNKNPNVSLSVVYPKGGEKLCIGDTIIVKWEEKGLRSVTAWVMKDGMTSYPLGGASADANELDWKVGQGNGFTLPEGQGYELDLTGRTANTADAPVYAKSEKLFTISDCKKPISSSTAANKSAFVKVVSPNGGQQLCIGKNADIKWTSSGVDAISLFAYKPTGAGRTFPIKDLPASFNETGTQNGSGTYSWNVDIPEGYVYKIMITAIDKTQNNLVIHDESDGLFSVSNCQG